MANPKQSVCAAGDWVNQQVHLAEKPARPTPATQGIHIDRPTSKERQEVVIRLIDFLKNL
ncbi:MAG TPA: hypothetical protein VLH85_08145 [Levilinea sp.]|nr:hypothetical protein [Levilinea sp.]